MLSIIKNGRYFYIVFITLSSIVINLPSVESEQIVKAIKTHNNIHKVVMTQKGYIQFLRYKVDVPPLSRFTFCVWLKSVNFTHAHPVISYSLHERDRLLRAWISPGGRWLRLRILEQELPGVKVDMKEHKWTHVCFSWHAAVASWQVYIDGRLRGQGIHEKLRDIIIPGGGDMIVGQEYTDFDKGLDDGIEGEIFGFNMVLSSTTEAGNHNYFRNQESRHFYQAIPPNDEETNYQSEYIRFADLADEFDQIKKDNLKRIKSESLPNTNRDVHTDLQIDIDDSYKVNVDYVTRKPKRARVSGKTNDHTVEIEYFPEAPRTFSNVRHSPNQQAYVDTEDHYLIDSPDELLSPPNPAEGIPFWQQVNKAGQEGRFKTLNDVILQQEGSLENHPLPLTNLPIYETPPALPIYHNAEPEVPSYEVKYAQENFKGNEWYDQNDYFPKELLRHNAKRRRPSHHKKSKNHGKSKSKNKHHHHHHHPHSHPPHSHKNKHSHVETSELFPYPSEKNQVFVANDSDFPIERKKIDTKNNHSVFKRETSNGQKNIQILNPESVIVYPKDNEVVNVEVIPRAGEFPSIDYDTSHESNYETNNDNNNYMTVVLTLENQNRLKNHRMNGPTNTTSYYDAQSSNTREDFSVNGELQNQNNDHIDVGKELQTPSYEVQYSQRYYTGSKNKLREQNSGTANTTERWADHSFNDPRYTLLDNKKIQSDNNVGYNHFVLNRQVLYDNPIYSHVANAFKKAKNTKESNVPENIVHNFESLRIKSNQGIINPYSLYTSNQNKRIEPSLIKMYPESIHDKINGPSDFRAYSSTTEAAKKNEHAQFGKPVKLGNALNEIQIFRQHGNDRVTSFVNSDDKIPDIHKYRSDIDENDNVKKSLSNQPSNDDIYEFNDINVNNHEVFKSLQRKYIKNTEPPLPLSAGRKLVELSYRKCLLGRGSPLASDPSNLISWTLTPVRVFGGAILKQAQPSCGSF